jgi:hypothetical protein
MSNLKSSAVIAEVFLYGPIRSLIVGSTKKKRKNFRRGDSIFIRKNNGRQAVTLAERGFAKAMDFGSISPKRTTARKVKNTIIAAAVTPNLLRT